MLICIANAVSAYTFLNLYVEDNGVVTFLGETNENLSLPNGVNIQDGKIIGDTSTLTSKVGEVWSLAYNLHGAEINLVLPKGAVIKQISDGEISTQNNQISVYFKDSVVVNYTIENTASGISARNIGLTILSILVIVTLILFVRYAMKNNAKNKPQTGNAKVKRQNSVKQKQKIIQQLLNEREKTILSKLKETGKVKQSQLRKLVQIPKASFSRHLQELEKKMLINRSGDGKNKFVELN